MDPKCNLPPANDDHGFPSHGSQAPNVVIGVLKRIERILRLLIIGYASEGAQFEYENHRHWEQLHATLLRKVENVGVVSGLLLASNANLLISSNGDLRRMTYTSVAASILSAFVSLFLDLLCLWALIGMHPSRLELLTKRSMLFYYMCGTPSLFGGASALAFFAAVGSWVWLDSVNEDRNRIAKYCAIALGGILVLNTCVCFYLGGSMRGSRWVRQATHTPNDTQQSAPAGRDRNSQTWSQVSDVIIRDDPEHEISQSPWVPEAMPVSQ
ncbi:hypothetical protein P691DRAFT_808879 [Macrolepiota fuliginosa MF-IS2]|uniref:Uncharacterized protein n=1 Tax=Macrolepiota fuliginosa MF-IS2 TaxID=1400762 RepID=A0A9P5XKV8_9AGAR|nr:hypothetical protein P691DRAFT_808879 [Macrolepiota fuliginosa MF-IS2]